MGSCPKVNTKGHGSLKLSPSYTEEQWRDAFNGHEDWDTAINIVEDRIKGRWLDAANRLLDMPHSGFAILALDCIILESMWGFKNGKAAPENGGQVYRDILTHQPFGWTDELSESFRKRVRNGIMHDAETRNGWLVEKTVPANVIVSKDKNGDQVLNRTKFHNALKGAFGEWVVNLRNGDAPLRRNMRKRMDKVIAKHYAH
jgi:hypothetical protein